MITCVNSLTSWQKYADFGVEIFVRYMLHVNFEFKIPYLSIEGQEYC